MKLVIGVPIVVLAAATMASAQPAMVINEGADEVTTIKAKVEAVDVAKREITLTGPLGRTVTYTVGDRVKNLAQVKVGDELVLKYSEALSVDLRKGGEAGRQKTTTTTPTITAQPGAMPAAAKARQTTITANVERVDPARQVVLLQGPGGRYVEVKVKDPAAFKTIQPGDKVDATYTEAVLIEVVTPGK
jgi:Cu/Ag efflux protein CusF